MEEREYQSTPSRPMRQYRSYRTKKFQNGKIVEQAYAHGAWRNLVERECYYCGNHFKMAKSANDLGHYCSFECVAKNNLKANKAKRKTKKCEICSQPFKVQPSKRDRYRSCARPYCARMMQSKSMKERWRVRRMQAAEEGRGVLE